MYLIVGLLLIFSCGFFSPIQTAVNSRLRVHVVSPFVATFVSFVVGCIAIAVIVMMQYGTLWMAAPGGDAVPWWAWLGGACGAVGIAVNVLLFPRLGGVKTVLMPMLGQVLMGMLIDSFGLFGAQVVPVSALRVVGALLAVGGAYFVVKKKSEEGGYEGRQWPWLILGVIGGALMGMQPSLNSFLAVYYNSTSYASLISFVTGMVLLLLFLFVNGDYKHIGKSITGGAPWWAYMGGLIGVGVVFCLAYFASRIEIVLLNILNIFGMLVASVLIDCFGLLGSTKIKIRAIQYCGLGLILLGILCIHL